MNDDIIAYAPRLTALAMLKSPAMPETCFCGLLKLDYLPERRLGRVVHGMLVCYREENP